MIEDISNRLLRDFATCLHLAAGRRAGRRPSGEEVAEGEAPPEAVAAAAPRRRRRAASRGRRAAATAAARPRRRLSPQAAKPVGGIGLFFSRALGADQAPLRALLDWLTRGWSSASHS